MPGELLSVVELGGYPDFSALYKRFGYEPTVEYSMRKALHRLKRKSYDVVVAEFNYQHTFRDRLSSLESLIAAVQKHPNIRLIVFYEKEHAEQFKILESQYAFYATVRFPIMESKVEAILSALAKEDAV